MNVVSPRVSALAAVFLFGCSFGLSVASALAQDPEPAPVIVPAAPVCPPCPVCPEAPPAPPVLSPEQAAAIQRALDAINAADASQKMGPNP